METASRRFGDAESRDRFDPGWDGTKIGKPDIEWLQDADRDTGEVSARQRDIHLDGKRTVRRTSVWRGGQGL